MSVHHQLFREEMSRMQLEESAAPLSFIIIISKWVQFQFFYASFLVFPGKHIFRVIVVNGLK